MTWSPTVPPHGCPVPLAPLPLPPPHPAPMCSEASVGVLPPCLCLGPSVHLPLELEAGSHNEEVGAWPGLNKALGTCQSRRRECLLSPTDPLFMWLSGPQRTKRRPRRDWANWTQRGSRQNGPVWPPSKWLVRPTYPICPVPGPKVNVCLLVTGALQSQSSPRP